MLSAASRALVLTSAIYFFCPPVADNDLWGHVAFGREMLRSGRLPAVNRYSYTEPMHSWINHEWGAECIFASVFDGLGSSGLLALKIGVGLLTLAIVARTVRLRSRGVLSGAFVLIASASMMSFGFMIRPQIFTFFALAVLWNRVQACAQQRVAQTLWVLPPLFALWVNLHGGVMAGLVLLFAFTVVASLEGVGVPRGALIATSLACAAALLVNPYGIRLPLFLAEDLLRSRPISEWSPIALVDLSNLQFKLVCVLLLAGLAAGTCRRAWEAVIVACAGIATFRHQRHLPLFAILAAPALVETIDFWSARVSRSIRLAQLPTAGTTAVAVAAVVLSVGQLAAVLGIYRLVGGQIFVSPDQFPISAVRFINEHGLTGNLAVAFDWGEYAIWHLYPRCPVSVDGRYSTAYSDDLLADALAFRGGTTGWDRTLRDASLALVDKRDRVAELLGQHPDWECKYADATAMVFARGKGPGACPPSTTESRAALSLFP